MDVSQFTFGPLRPKMVMKEMWNNEKLCLENLLLKEEREQLKKATQFVANQRS